MEPFVYVVYDPGDIVTASYRVPDNVKSCKNAQIVNICTQCVQCHCCDDQRAGTQLCNRSITVLLYSFLNNGTLVLGSGKE